MSDYLDLFDYRRRVTALYNERNWALLAQEDPARVLQQFRQGRDELFAHHPQSALDEVQRNAFKGLHYFPYNPALVIAVDVDTNVEPVRHQVVMNANESMVMTTVGRVQFMVEQEVVSLSLYWLDIYGGGLFLPFRD